MLKNYFWCECIPVSSRSTGACCKGNLLQPQSQTASSIIIFYYYQYFLDIPPICTPSVNNPPGGPYHSNPLCSPPFSSPPSSLTVKNLVKHRKMMIYHCLWCNYTPSQRVISWCPYRACGVELYDEWLGFQCTGTPDMLPWLRQQDGPCLFSERGVRSTRSLCFPSLLPTPPPPLAFRSALDSPYHRSRRIFWCRPITLPHHPQRFFCHYSYTHIPFDRITLAQFYHISTSLWCLPSAVCYCTRFKIWVNIE